MAYKLKSMLYNLKLNRYITPKAAKDMVEERKGPKKIKPEELLSRFRSKEDLYRYLTLQGKIVTQWLIML